MEISFTVVKSLLREALKSVPRALEKMGIYITYGRPDPIPVQIMVEQAGKVQPLVVDLNKLLFSDHGIVYMLKQYRKKRPPKLGWRSVRGLQNARVTCITSTVLSMHFAALNFLQTIQT